MNFQNLLASMKKGGEEESAARKRARYSKIETSEEGSELRLSTSSQGSDRGEDKNLPPHFLIIGVQKAGTMAAVTNLNKHPEIFVEKEVHYFDVHWHLKTPAWYRSKFDVSDKRVKGEKTPELIYVDECAERIKQICPDAKFILILRDPIARAYSSWNMNTSKGRENQPFDECVSRNLENLNEERSYGTAEYHYVQRGFYYEQIERFLKTFPNKDNLLILIAERLKTNPDQEHARIFKFLGVSQCHIDAEYDHIGNYNTIIGNKVEEKLRRIYKPHNERLFKFLGYRIPEWENNYVSPLDGTTFRRGSGTSDSGEKKCDEVADTLANLSEGVTAAAAAAANGALIQPKKNTSRTTLAVDKNHIQDPCISSAGDFSTLGRRHDTDKITHHGYHRYYPRYLEYYRQLTLAAATTSGSSSSSGSGSGSGNTSSSSSGSSSSSSSSSSSTVSKVVVNTSHMLGMLEIGVDKSHSLHTWLDYFPHAFIYGMDISVSDRGNRFKILQCDQSKIRDVREAVEKQIKHPLFFIIDDGSHVPEHQIKCFDYLFDAALLPGGTYIIEDIETSYWTRGDIYFYPTRYGYHHERSIIEIFKDLLDDINREFLTQHNRSLQEKRVGGEVSLKTRLEISTISFGQNCIIITKKTPEEKRAYDERVYRFRQHL